MVSSNMEIYHVQKEVGNSFKLYTKRLEMAEEIYLNIRIEKWYGNGDVTGEQNFVAHSLQIKPRKIIYIH